MGSHSPPPLGSPLQARPGLGLWCLGEGWLVPPWWRKALEKDDMAYNFNPLPLQIWVLDMCSICLCINPAMHMAKAEDKKS